MPSTRRWSVSHQRIEISVALAAVGTFLICGGIGMTNWVVAGFGVGLLAAGSSIFGLSAINSRAYSFVAGTGHVLRASDPTASTGHGRCHMIMIVHAKNLDGHRVKIRDDRVPISKWPGAGVNLPILVDVDDPRRVRVLWKEVPTHVQAATARAADDASYVGEPAYVAAPQSGATAYDRTGYEPTGYGEDPGGYDATGLPDDLIGGEGGTAATDEATSDSDADFDEAEVMSGSVLEFDIDPLVMPGDNRGGRRRDTDPGRRRPSPRPRRPADAAAARAEGTAVRADDGTVRADDIAVRADDADRTGGVPDGPAKPPGPRLSAGDSPDVTADPPVDKRWDIPKTAAASAAASGVTADAAGTVTPARDESVHPALWVDQAHVVTERLTATPDGAADTPYDQDEDPTVADVYLATSPPPGTGQPTRIHSMAVTMLVSNLDRSVAFYRDVLGFAEIANRYPSARLERQGARIVLRATALPEPVNRRLVQLVLDVPDVEAAYQDLRNRGVSFIHRPRPVSQYEQFTQWAATLHDPDGHAISIAQWRPND